MHPFPSSRDWLSGVPRDANDIYRHHRINGSERSKRRRRLKQRKGRNLTLTTQRVPRMFLMSGRSKRRSENGKKMMTDPR